MAYAPVWSVIIPAWEAQEAIGRCLRSLVEQRNAPPFEVLVVDSSATDATRRVVEEILPDLTGLDYHHLDQRSYPGVARNAGASRARGQWLLFLDADVIADEDLLARAEASQQASPGVVGGAIGLADASRVSARLRHIFEFKESLPGVPARTTWQLPTACLTMARQAFLDSDGFPSLRASEDWLFNWKQWSDGTPMRLDPLLQVEHATAAGWRDFSRYARVLGHASGRARRIGGLPGQWLVRAPWLSVFLPLGRTGRALLWCGRYSPADFRLLLWAWPAYLLLAGIWAREFRRGVVGLPPPRPER